MSGTHNTGQNVLAPRSATLDAITRVNGIADLPTEEMIDEAELDANGFYPSRRQHRIDLLPEELADDVRNAGGKLPHE